ncbi:hypothetical protein [Helicobacter cetorum]|uniref:Uncharacterized protein n=2 Tax=Helicobacter cetorum TaxID=138563 RepID=I0EPM7_HELC0|nr:hypothetical protein [Helicobacter cetorum]ABS86830.1 hypothetical protein pz33w [Helicobacter cetorum]AFI04896.1 hypothetical protein HCW_08195 [Helicobacter cetorum MIT 00-7128]
MEFIKLKDKTFALSVDFKELTSYEKIVKVRKRAIEDLLKNLGIESAMYAPIHQEFTHLESQKSIIGVFFDVNNKDNYTLILMPPKTLKIAREMLKDPYFLKFQKVFNE